MIERTTEVSRTLLPLTAFVSDVHTIRGVVDSAPHASEELHAQLTTNSSNIVNDEHIPLSSLYAPEKIVSGQKAETSRYVFTTAIPNATGGSGIIYNAFDRLTGAKGIAKIITNYVTGDARIEYNKILQREAEVMMLFQQDPFLRHHIVPIWDIAFVHMNSRDSTIVFEEYLDPQTKPMLEETDLSAISIENKLNLVGQLCMSVDRMAEYGVFHYDLVPKNLYIDLSAMKLLIADFGIANIVFDVTQWGSQGKEEFATLERLLYTGKEEEPGLISEVFSTAVISFYILFNKEMPYNRLDSIDVRRRYPSTDGLFETHFSPNGKTIMSEQLSKASYSPEHIDALSAVFEKALAKERKDRYQTGQELLHAIQDALSTEEPIVTFVRESSLAL